MPTTTHAPNRETGASLFVALIILVAITLVSLGALASGVLQLKMANTTEAGMTAFQLAQSAVDNVITDAEANFIVGAAAGGTACANITGCNTTIANLSAPITTSNQIKITQTSTQGCPPRSRQTPTSCSSMNAASFTVDSLYDRSSLGRGKSELYQGYIKLIPLGGQGAGSAPATASHN